MLPRTFDDRGVLPQDCEATFAELRHSLLVMGPEPVRPNWQPGWRRTLLDNLEILVRQLWAAGITTVYIDGSFVQNVAHPGDIDGCFECDFMEWQTGALERRLNEVAPKKIWTWDEKSKRLVLGVPRYPMWATYKVELYPYSREYATGIMTDEGLVTFPDAFRLIKGENGTKGIIKLIKD